MLRALVVWFTLLVTTGAVAAGAAQLDVQVGAPARNATSATYTLVVGRLTQPVMVLLPPNAISAELIRGTLTLESNRNQTSAFGPLDHSRPSFEIDDLHAGEHLILRLKPATASAPRLIGDIDIIAQAEKAARITGVVFGVLLAVAVWQSAAFWFARDLTIIPFLLAIASRGALEALRGDMISPDVLGPAPVTLFAIEVIEAAAEIAFIVGFLRFKRAVVQPVVIATLGAFVAVLLTVGLLPAVLPFAESAWPIFRLVFAAPLIIAAMWRLRNGFTPAAFILIAIIGNIASTIYLMILDRTGTLVAPLDPLMFQIATAFPALILALGLPYRTRFLAGEREMLERDLQAAEFAADHDPLTGLLNRRGLATWTAATRLAGGTLLFIDLDGFKRVNDSAGHDAGDRTLIAVANLLSAAVRTGDAVARVGGDEFVVILDARSANRADEIAQRITGDIAALGPFACGIRIGASIGKAEFGNRPNVAQTLAAADAETYRIKAARRATSQRS